MYSSTFVLWNPCVRKYITIPKSDLIPPQSRWVCCGFGFDSRTNDYKILRVSIKESDEYIEAHIYSLKQDSWKSLPAPKFSIKSDDPMVFVNGVVHWISYRKAENDVFESVVMGFHMGDEVFNMIRLPEAECFNYDNNLGEVYLTMYPEASSIAVMHKDDFSGQCHVWVMKEYGVEETWTKLLSFGKWGEVPEVAAFRKDGGLIVKTFKGEMVSYYPERSEAKKLGIGGEFEYFIVVRHMESLVLHDIGNHEYDDSDLGDSSDESTDTGSDSSNYLTDDSIEDGSDDVSDNSTDEGTDNSTDEGTDFPSDD
ncbi:hypothetical protein CCACVL1_06944 [Corchorus capsularis]|uniref:F-box associated beta-propeller type 1 domain-containing protein n=1 Tax=Corchorus capsularis TaxID=210143 RepID=A0A1R3JAX7_COCAP|nr:hypothetical protein CCACVL1_06944 [Corchorus capsularis]